MPCITNKKRFRDPGICGAQATMREDNCGRAATRVSRRKEIACVPANSLRY
ncbi:MAG: hypothetical protein AABM67_18455 [Acidobacteriota bacterium]